MSNNDPTGERVVKERPILFSGPMVRAILAGRKTQTRRVVKLPFSRGRLDQYGWTAFDPSIDSDRNVMPAWCPYGAPGDRLWVRETWRLAQVDGRDGVIYAADNAFRPNDGTVEMAADWVEDDTRKPGEWRPSIFCRRWVSRLTLDVTAVRVERLQAITEADALAEGVERGGPGEGAWHRYTADGPSCEGPRESFRSLWESINGTGSWAANPWVWVVEFRKVEQ